MSLYELFVNYVITREKARALSLLRSLSYYIYLHFAY